MATFRKRNGKWQAIVRQKNIGTVSRSFIKKTQAIKWALEQEERIERGVFGAIEPSEVTLGELLKRYSQQITPAKRGAETEQRRLNRLINDSISDHSIEQLTSKTLASFRDRRLLDGQRACEYDLILIRHCLKVAMATLRQCLMSIRSYSQARCPSSSLRSLKLANVFDVSCSMEWSLIESLMRRLRRLCSVSAPLLAGVIC